MKKFLTFLCAVTLVLGLVGSASAYSINDGVNDAIGNEFESYGIDVYNFTPGVNSGNIAFDLYTDYPEAGITVGTWATEVADLFVTENYKGTDYLWAIPLVDHDTFTAGHWYAVGSVYTSDDFEPTNDGYTYTYNNGAPVRIAASGNNYGYSSFNGSATWNDPVGDNPDFTIRLQSTVYEDDANATFDLFWGTATCGNDIVEGSAAPVPEPSTILLMGIGLLGLVGYSRKRKKS